MVPSQAVVPSIGPNGTVYDDDHARRRNQSCSSCPSSLAPLLVHSPLEGYVPIIDDSFANTHDLTPVVCANFARYIMGFPI